MTHRNKYKSWLTGLLAVVMVIFTVAFASQSANAQVTESFANAGEDGQDAGQYRDRSWTGDDGGTWNSTDSRIDQPIDGFGISVLIRNGTILSPSYSGGLGSITITTQRFFTGGSGDIPVIVNGTQVGTVPYSDAALTTTLDDIDVAGSVIVEVGEPSGSGDRVSIGQISWTGFTTDDPTISVSPVSITGLDYIEGDGPSAEQTFTVQGENLEDDITISPPANFEISQTSGSGFTTGNITLPETDGSVGETTIYVRLLSGLSIGSYSGDITVTSTDANPASVALSGQVREPIFLIYEFTDDSVAPTQQPPDATTSNFQISTGSISFGSTGTWSGSGTPYAQGSGGWTATSAEAAKNFFFTIDAEEGKAVDLTDISFEWRTTGAGPSAITVEINGIEVSEFDSGQNEQDFFSEELSGFTNLPSVEVRIKGWDNESRTTSGGGDFRINDVRLDGQIVDFVPPAVPDPVFSVDEGTYFENQTVFIDNFGDYEPSAVIYYTTDGNDPDEQSDVYDDNNGILLEDGNGPITLKAIAIDGAEESNITSAIYTFPVNVADIEELRSQDTENGTIYRVTNEATLIGQTNFRNTKFFQDDSGFGIQIDDPGPTPGTLGVISSEYNLGDNVSSLVGTIGAFQGQLRLTPVLDPGDAVSSGNVVIPVPRTLDELGFDDQARLVLVENVVFEDGDGTSTFGGGGFNTNITDPSLSDFGGIYRNVFGESNITNSLIPQVPVNITGVVQEINAGLTLSARSLDDFDPVEKMVGIAGEAGWRMLSAPVTGATVADIAGQNQVQGFAGLVGFYDGQISAGIETASPNLYLGYDGTGWTPANALTNELESGKGFIWYMYNNDLGVSVPLPFTLTLEGIAPVGDVTVSLHSDDNGFNLLGNPFPSSLDLSGLAGWAVNGELDSGIAQVWESTAPVAGEHDGTWRQIGFGAADGEVLTSWQGFMVENTPGTEGADAIVIPTSARTTGGTFLKETTPVLKRLALTLDGKNDEAGIRTRDRASLVFSDRADDGWDLLDASQLTPLSTSFATLSFVGERNGETILKSQESRPADFEGTLELPASLGTRNMSGDMTITWEGLADLPTEWQFTLVDNETGASVDMRSAASYEFRIEGAIEKRQLEADVTIPEIAPMTAGDELQPRFTVIISSEPVSTETPSDLPDQLELAQNYPNPFNPTTLISYALPEQTHVRLTVYDMLGRTVSVLVDDVQAPGSYRVNWDATGVTSGVYIYRLTAEGQTLTRSMTLVK